MDRDWANFEALALGVILDKLGEQIDHVWFGAVCKNWCSVAKFHHQNKQFRSNVLPMLMIPTEGKSGTKRSLYGIPSNRIYHLQLSVPYIGRCCGSGHGWLAIIKHHYVITLLNPFKDVAPIHLPPIDIEDYKHCSIHKVKVILSADPTTSPNDYVVVAIHRYSNIVAFIKAGKMFWTYVQIFHFLTDATIYKGLVYAVTNTLDIVCFSLSSEYHSRDWRNIITGIYVDNYNNLEQTYLVKSLEGDLWLVRRFFGYGSGTRNFKVYKLELDAQHGKLLNRLKLESLGDNVLFLGDNTSICVSASCSSNCLSNDSIYFTDGYYSNKPISHGNIPFDMGIYNLKDKSISEHYPRNPSFWRMPHPIWVLPPFKWD